jgi:hypothetical protein
MARKPTHTNVCGVLLGTLDDDGTKTVQAIVRFGNQCSD